MRQAAHHNLETERVARREDGRLIAAARRRGTDRATRLMITMARRISLTMLKVGGGLPV